MQKQQNTWTFSLKTKNLSLYDVVSRWDSKKKVRRDRENINCVCGFEPYVFKD